MGSSWEGKGSLPISHKDRKQINQGAVDQTSGGRRTGTAQAPYQVKAERNAMRFRLPALEKALFGFISTWLRRPIPCVGSDPTSNRKER